MTSATNCERQMLRDLLAETRLIRSRAKPISIGKTTYVMMNLFEHRGDVYRDSREN